MKTVQSGSKGVAGPVQNEEAIKIEITPQMIGAGTRVFDGAWDHALSSPPQERICELAVEVFEAMVKASPQQLIARVVRCTRQVA